MADAAGASAAPAWRVRPLVSLSWHEWPDEGSVAFDDTSGQIIELDVLGAAVMACLESQPATIDTIAQLLAGDLGQQADDEFRSAVADIVEQFRHLGWVDPIIV